MTNTSGFSPTAPTADEARTLLDQADGLGRQAVAGASWPAVAFLLGMGAATSIGCLALGLTTGTPYFIVMWSMLAWLGVLMTFLFAFNRTAKRGFGRRWRVYMGVWAAAYLVAIIVNSGAEGQRLLWTCLSAALVAAATVACAWYEARR